MYFLTVFVGFLIVYATMSVTKNLGGVNTNDDAVLSPSESDSDDYDDSSESEASEDVSEDMKDFYDETTLSPEWLAKSDKEKKLILDKDLEEYMSKNKDL